MREWTIRGEEVIVRVNHRGGVGNGGGGKVNRPARKTRDRTVGVPNMRLVLDDIATYLRAIPQGGWKTFPRLRCRGTRPCRGSARWCSKENCGPRYPTGDHPSTDDQKCGEIQRTPGEWITCGSSQQSTSPSLSPSSAQGSPETRAPTGRASLPRPIGGELIADDLPLMQ